MSKLYTRHGDDGWTVLFDGTRVRKNDPRVEAYGTVDELNARMGVVLAALTDRPGGSEWRALAERLTQIQGELFCVGAELATPPEAGNRTKVPTVTVEREGILVPAAPEAGNRTKAPAVAPEHVARLEAWIDEAAAATPALRNFILPGGDPVAAQLHVCRAVCRRAERTVVTLASAAPLSPLLIVYLNRLGDLLFAWSRLVNHLAGTPESIWVYPPSP